MRYAIVKNKKVIEIINVDENTANIYAKLINAEAWYVSLDCEIGMDFIDGIYSKPAVIPESEISTSLKYIMSVEIDRLNAKYENLNLSLNDDNIFTALKKFIDNNVLKEDTIYISNYYNLLGMINKE